MRTAAALLVAILLLVVVAAMRGDDVSGETSPAAEPKTAPSRDDFAGKIALVYLDALVRSPSAVLRDVEIMEVGGRKFLAGAVADTSRDEDWRTGKQIRISWPLVTGHLLFTAEQYAQHVKDAKEEREDN